MNIFVIGDSISVQYGPYLATYLDGVMGYARKQGEQAALVDLDDPQGTNGGDSGRVLAYLQAKAARGGIDAELLLVNCGLHDIKADPVSGAHQVPLEQYQENLRAIVATVAPMKPQLVWMRTTPCDERVHNYEGRSFYRFAADGRAYNQAADQIMTAAGVPIIDLYTFTDNLGSDLYCDHVHFKEPIREKQAAYIAGWLAGYCAR
ncbi:MAG: SGNH/GDSL hydrolase family protein [Candidatus Marinimicrobia bacterium]|nr:SGNH/GDSL hydrolase family protein [Candidatus Neomarinimicrobiota bacterium]